jgi:hypothetical protein
MLANWTVLPSPPLRAQLRRNFALRSAASGCVKQLAPSPFGRGSTRVFPQSENEDAKHKINVALRTTRNDRAKEESRE